ncbi:ABC transporter ATP-binding protein [Cumulibacter manganitolerans]|uniref:ABC transporter ATP-binding protein n=1 Tax=Cumulibacter manganitolerans TaxID=1884992 RepID=UPI001295375B|nr:ABC transporter ATP-binding protein [Cumulibacter manganitolerans]
MGTSVAHLVGVEVTLGGTPVLTGIDLTVQQGSCVAVLGRSGAGKSTLLKVLENQIVPDAGTIELAADGRPQRQAVVYQQALLFDWLTVRENIALGLGYGRNRAANAERVPRLLELLEIAELAERYPDQLSGGQAQRVALGRALAVEPELLLLDEPFSALDPATRSSLQGWLREESRRENLTSVIVTHDIDEAVLLADQIVLIDGGRIEHRWTVADETAARETLRDTIRAAFDLPASAAPTRGELVDA